MIGPRRRTRPATVLNAILMFATTALVASCALGSDTDVVVVRITGSGFDPATLTVDPGTEVRWSNETNQVRTIDTTGVTFNQGRSLPAGPEAFISEPLRQGETYARVLTSEGVYVYTVGPIPDEQFIAMIEVTES